MKQKLLIAIALLCSAFVTYAGVDKSHVWEGKLKVEQFQAFLDGGYTQVNGDVAVTDKHITNLSALKNLTTVTGYFDIGQDYSNLDNNDALTTLTGLERLTSVSGRFSIQNNEKLANVDALKNLKSVGELKIHNNDTLVNLQGLERLKSAEKVSIFGNGKLQSIKALGQLKQVSSISIRYNFELKSLEGLGQVTNVDELIVSSNQVLATLKGFDKVTQLDTLYIDGNQKLHAIDALSGLERVNTMYISANGGRLFSKWALPRLTQVTSLRLINQEWFTLQPFKRLTKLKHLDIQFMPLDDLSGLESLKSADYILLANNDYLKSLKGLNGLERVKGLVITKNPVLSSLEGLSNIRALPPRQNNQSSSHLWHMPYTEGIKFYEKAHVNISKNKALANYDAFPLAFLKNTPSSQVSLYSNADNPSWQHLKLAARISKEPISEAELTSNSLKELSLLRNEVFARQGYEFSESLQPYFEKKGWYKKSEDQSITLSKVEEVNLNTIKGIEKARKQVVKTTLSDMKKRYKHSVDFLKKDYPALQSPFIEFIQSASVKTILESDSLQVYDEVVCEERCEYGASIRYDLSGENSQVHVNLTDLSEYNTVSIQLKIDGLSYRLDHIDEYSEGG